MKQVYVIHGGESHDSYERYLQALEAKDIDYDGLKPSKKWREWIADQLLSDDVLLPTMPNGYNAVYEEWKIYFEKLIPFFNDNVQLVGHSLGAMFLAIYLNEAPLATKVRRVILVAPGYDDDMNEDLGSFKVTSAVNVPRSADEVHLFHSEDDPVVPYGELAKFRRDMPSAVCHSFTDRGHFLDPTFPELLDLLKQK